LGAGLASAFGDDYIFEEDEQGESSTTREQ
jgi:hypothetical protein